MTGLRLGHNETTASRVFLASEIVFVEGRGLVLLISQHLRIVEEEGGGLQVLVRNLSYLLQN